MKKIFTLLTFLLAVLMANSQSTTVVISQVYGGGGANTGTPTYKVDYIELHNVSTTTQNLDGFSLQYASAAGTFSNVYAFPAGTSIPAGGYLLVQSGTVGTAGADLPVASNLSAGLNLSGASGKVALASQAAALACGSTAVPCTGSIIDVVAYGAASGTTEGGTTVNNGVALTTTQGAVRKNNGCQDTDNNNSDFDVVTAPVPRNAASAVVTCSGAPSASITGSPNVTGLVTTSGTASADGTFSVTGSNLTGFPGNISATASANLEVSLTAGGPYSSAVNIAYASATLAATSVYVRITNAAPAGAINGTVTLAGGGDADGASVTVTGSVVASEPTTQATNVTFSNIGDNGFDANWTNGNGTSRLVVVKTTTTTAVPPTDGTEYAVNATTGTGNRVVFSGTGTGPVTITGLTAGTSYDVQVYEFNGSAGSNNYLTASATGNPATTSTTGVSPNLQQINFHSVATPQYIGGGISTTRLPVMYYATVTGLSPNTSYRYITQAQLSSNFGGTALGAGNPILINHSASPMTFIYSTSPSVNTANSYGLFETDATGSFTGAFGFVPSGNATYFTSGLQVYPTIAIAEDVDPATIQYRFALDQSVTVINTGAADGTFIKGLSSAIAGNVVGLWSTVDGNLVAQRPLAMTIVEAPTFAGATWGTSFITGYDLTAGAWNTIIPNANANGVRLIQQFDLATGNVIGCNSDADGVWPSGANTVSPTGGSTAIQITAAEAPINTGSCFSILPVTISSFNVQKSGNNARISWTTEQEINTREFVVERSRDQRTWTTVATIAAAGTSSSRLSYSTTDFTPAKGINFYRLKLVDANNSFTNSATKSVLFGSADAVLVTPNPATSFATVYMGKTDNSVSEIVVSDLNGKIIERARTADQTYTLETGRYSKGLYVIKVITGATITTNKLVVQ
ncbi:MAG: lamin tail domain-containing protein [Ferruginibacter sp.]